MVSESLPYIIIHPSLPGLYYINGVASAGNQLSHSQCPAHPNVRWLWTEGYCNHSNQSNCLFHTLKSTINQNYSVTLTGCCEVLGEKICISNKGKLYIEN